MAAAYTLYDVLRMLVNKSQFTEEESIALFDSIAELQRINALGTTVANIQCPHDEAMIGDDGVCECGRRIAENISKTYAQRRADERMRRANPIKPPWRRL